MGIDPSSYDDDDEEEKDSTVKGLTEDDNTAANDTTTLTNKNNTTIAHSENETFEFHQVDTSNTTSNTKAAFGKASTKRKEAPLPHQIFAPDAKVVLPQALTASQLFGIERLW